MKTRRSSIVLMVGLVLSLSTFAGAVGIAPTPASAASCPTDVQFGCNLVGTSAGSAGWRVENSSSTSGSIGLFGSASANATNPTYGVQGMTNSSAGTGVYGFANAATGFTNGVRGLSSSSSGNGLSGLATAGSGSTFGVHGQSLSVSGAGVFGVATAPSGSTYGVSGQSFSNSGIGIYGYANATSGSTRGVLGRSDSPSGAGIYGAASATTGTNYGVAGYSPSTSGVGVRGDTTAASGYTYGVWGESVSPNGRGVIGRATATSGTTYGVVGQADSSAGRGVYGLGTYGVYGQTTSPGGAAIYGANAGGGDAGYFNGHVTIDRGALGQGALNVNGDVAVFGILSGYLKLFRIDHPLDPANKYLNHVSVESPDMKNIYDGVITLDAKGTAVVELPAYFEALNKDFRYQLTAIGAPGPHLYIAEEIQGNHFTIDGGKPNTKVSWQVTGIRHDAWAMAHPMPVEQDKPAEQRGLYLTPKEQGQPESKGMNYAREQQMTANQPQVPAVPDAVPPPPAAPPAQ